MYVDGMSEDHLGQLATAQQLTLFAIASTLCAALIIITTWTGNDDMWNKIGDEMKMIARFTAKWSWNLIGWIPATYYFLQARNLGIQDDYPAKHRFA